MKCYGFAVFWNFRILKVVLGYKKWSKTAENEDSQRKIVELSNDMSDVFLAFLEMKCDTPYPTLFKWGEFMDSCEGSSLKHQKCTFSEDGPSKCRPWKFFLRLRGYNMYQKLVQTDQSYQSHQLLIDLYSYMRRYWPIFKNACNLPPSKKIPI